MPIHFKETQYGFEWGAATVERCCSDRKKGWVVMRLQTPRIELQVYVTRTGKVRVYNERTRKELKELK